MNARCDFFVAARWHNHDKLTRCEHCTMPRHNRDRRGCQNDLNIGCKDRVGSFPMEEVCPTCPRCRVCMPQYYRRSEQ